MLIACMMVFCLMLNYVQSLCIACALVNSTKLNAQQTNDQLNQVNRYICALEIYSFSMQTNRNKLKQYELERNVIVYRFDDE